jgi:hypothetical protein
MSQTGKPRLALNNFTAGVREREDANRTREAGHLDEVQGGVANTPELAQQPGIDEVTSDSKGFLKVRPGSTQMAVWGRKRHSHTCCCSCTKWRCAECSDYTTDNRAFRPR